MKITVSLFRKVTIIIVVTVVAIELFLRGYYGFCDAVLMRADKDFEYIAQPNQARHRFRKHIRYNSLSMRSDEPDAQSKIIIGFGDSVLNGGVLTDHDSLASTKLSTSLTRLRSENVQFLNVSAGSWGPDNCFEYLKKHGDFTADKIYLVVSSHDAYDSMDFMPVVGIHKSYPDKQYKMAIFELLERYVLPRLKYSSEEADQLGIRKKNRNSGFNEGFNSFLSYSNKHNIPLVVYLHADQIELAEANYNENGQEIIRWAKKHNIPLIQDLHHGLSKDHFRDGIHFNEKGQDLMAHLIHGYEASLVNF